MALPFAIPASQATAWIVGEWLPDRLKDLAAVALAFRAQGEPLPAVLDHDLFERLEILFDMQPIKLVPGGQQTQNQFLSERQRQKAAKQMVGHVGVLLLVNCARFQNRFHIPEHVLHPPQLFVLESSLFPRDVVLVDGSFIIILLAKGLPLQKTIPHALAIIKTPGHDRDKTGKNKKGLKHDCSNPLFSLVGRVGIEPTTY